MCTLGADREYRECARLGQTESKKCITSELDPSCLLHADLLLETSVTAVHRYKLIQDRLCGLVIRVRGYRSRGPGSIPGATRFSEE
jgi:hypothetical protein